MNTGNITKIKKQKNYTQISNDFLRDPSYSLKAKGLYCLIFSMPDDFAIYKTQLEKLNTDGKESLMNAWRELENAGHITSKREFKPNGKFQGWSYCFYEDREDNPEYMAIHGGVADISNHDIASHDSGKPATNNKEYKEERLEKEIIPPKGEKIFLSKEEKLEKRKTELLARREQFKIELRQFATKYQKDELEKFFLYWGEADKNYQKMRFEKQTTWELSRRLATWMRKPYNQQIPKPPVNNYGQDLASQAYKIPNGAKF